MSFQRQISFMEDEEIVQKLEAIAKRKGTTISALIREAIREFLAREAAKQI